MRCKGCNIEMEDLNRLNFMVPSTRRYSLYYCVKCGNFIHAYKLSFVLRNLEYYIFDLDGLCAANKSNYKRKEYFIENNLDFFTN